MFKRIYLGGCFILFAVVVYFFIITCKPVRNLSASDVSPVTGAVERTRVVRGNDMEIMLSGDQHSYYINNFKKNNINFEALAQQLEGKQVTLYYVNRWTPFTRDAVYPHIAKLILAEDVIYNEVIDE